MKILAIQSSPNLESSISRAYVEKVVQHLKSQNPQAEVMTRDLVKDAIPHVGPHTLGAFFTPAEARTAEQKTAIALSERLVDELLGADVIVIGSPMYNFSVPSSLKAWIDHIVRVGRTFKYTETGPVGLIPSDKKVIAVLSSGGIYSTGPAAGFDHLGTYMKGLFNFLGIQKVELVRLEGTAMGDSMLSQTKASADQLINQL
jgi:FMN-dependent NADH-azoreductase